jgi:glycosyltransferase involved in cell wall biosynthesis
MASGSPIVCSKAAAMPEVLGDSGIYFDPNSIESMRETLGKVLTEKQLRIDLGSRARQRAKLYSWEKTKESTINNLINAASTDK